MQQRTPFFSLFNCMPGSPHAIDSEFNYSLSSASVSFISLQIHSSKEQHNLRQVPENWRREMVRLLTVLSYEHCVWVASVWCFFFTKCGLVSCNSFCLLIPLKPACHMIMLLQWSTLLSLHSIEYFKVENLQSELKVPNSEPSPTHWTTLLVPNHNHFPC